LGQLCTAQQRWDRALEAFEQSCQAFHEAGNLLDAAMVRFYRGLVYLVRGEPALAAKQFEKAMGSAQQAGFRWSGLPLAYVLYGFEVSATKDTHFQSMFEHWNWDIDERVPLQWFLSPAAIGTFDDARVVEEDLVDAFSESWIWEDPFGDCAVEVRRGASIYAENGRDLWYTNRSAPRIVRPVCGDWALEVLCRPVSDERPAMGGLLARENEGSYLRLDWGMLGPRSILFLGCLDGDNVLVGRGAPAWAREARHLRLERVGGQIRALCSPDGTRWFQVGQAPLECDRVNIGLYAVGQIDRVLYPGSYRAGTAIGFNKVRVWQGTV
jgi:hypothetical protein